MWTQNEPFSERNGLQSSLNHCLPLESLWIHLTNTEDFPSVHSRAGVGVQGALHQTDQSRCSHSRKIPILPPPMWSSRGGGEMEVAQESPYTRPALLLDLWPRADHFPSVPGALPASIAEVYQRPSWIALEHLQPENPDPGGRVGRQQGPRLDL